MADPFVLVLDPALRYGLCPLNQHRQHPFQVKPFVVEIRPGHCEPFEYEYRCTEYE